ncbi:MAG TPA: NADH-quinone oxidoreductase subunit N [Anaerolineaceae bacterium]
MVNSGDIYAMLPIIVLLVWGMLVLLADLWVPVQRKGITALLAVAGLAFSFGLTLAQMRQPALAFNGMAVVDGFGVFLNAIYLISGIAGVALAHTYLKRMEIYRGEYYVLLLFSISGMMLMSYANDLIVVFLALELLSIPLYILSGIARPNPRSEEAGLKYFLLGTFSSAFVLYGVALIYGATARTDLPGIIAMVTGAPANLPLFVVGASLLLVGFGFKVAAVPFHMWTPDVYQGAPSPVTGFMSVGAKAAGFAALMRVFITVLPGAAADLTPILWGLAALTMIVGNIIAVAQNNIKRMLAYSSIAHAGYMLMAFVPYGNGSVSNNSVASLLFYLAAYAATSLGAWAVVVALEGREGKGLQLQDYAGLGRKYPWLAVPMVVFMLSFTGVPPTLGFWGKFYLFRTAVEGGYASLALIGLLTSLVSAYYYLRVVVFMYFRPGEPAVTRDAWVTLTAVVAAAAVLLLSLLPTPLFTWAAQALMRVQ